MNMLHNLRDLVVRVYASDPFEPGMFWAAQRDRAILFVIMMSVASLLLVFTGLLLVAF